MRATRVGGSFSSCARAFGAAKLKRPTKHSSRLRLLFRVNVVVFMTNPLSSVWTLAALALLMRRSSRRERNTLLILPLGRTPVWERSCHGGFSLDDPCKLNDSYKLGWATRFPARTKEAGASSRTPYRQDRRDVRLAERGIEGLLPALIIDSPADLGFLASPQDRSPNRAIAIIAGHVEAIHLRHT